MKISSKTFVIAVFILVAAFTVAYFATALLRGSNKQTDEELKRAYQNHSASFTKLARLFIDDPAIQYGSAATIYRNYGRGSVSDSKPPSEYVHLFEQTKILSGSRDRELELKFLAFPTYRRQLDGGDFSEKFYEEKGYAVMLGPAEKVEELVGSQTMYGKVEFWPIEYPWYIYQRVTVSKPE